MRFPLPPFEVGILQAKYEELPYPFYASSAEPLSLSELESLQDEEVGELLAGLKLGYAPIGGHPLLLEEIARSYGPSISPTDVSTFPGAQIGIFAALTTLLSEADHVIAVSPCYPSLLHVPEAICETTRVELGFGRGWRIDPDEIEGALRPNTRAIVLNAPNSPTGAVVDRETQSRLVELARRRGIWIFSDEVYRRLELVEQDRLPPIATVYERGISLGAMSKPFGLGGLLIGWTVCPDPRLRARTADLQQYLTVCNSAMAELHALTALRNAETIVSRRRQICRENLVLLGRFFDEYQELFEWVSPRSGCVGYPRFKSELRVEELTRQLAEGPGVLIMPASVFAHSGNFFRIGFGRTTMPAALQRFTEFVDANRKTW